MSKVEPRHPYVKTLEPYQPPDLEAAADRAGVEKGALIRLVANENPFGPSPRVAEALADFDGYHVHPDYGSLREAVARYAPVTPRQALPESAERASREPAEWARPEPAEWACPEPAEWVVLSNGADEMIDLLIRLFVEPGEAIVIAPPTFSMYRFSARVNRCRVLTVPRRDDLSLDAAAIERRVQGGEEGGQARMLFLVSPGNPSGRAIPLDVIERLLELPLLVVVDEAYIEFGGESALKLLPDHENLVILRTFSKWAGLAGLRLGYALLAPRLARYLERIRPPYNVNAAAMVAALATLDDLQTVQVHVACLVEERGRLGEALSQIPFLRPLPSQANFILCRVIDRDAQTVVDALLDRGILIRDFSDPAMASYVRITVGRPEQNDALVEALKDIARD